MENRILIVEDQRNSLKALELSLNKVMPNYFKDFSRDSYDIARCYNEAKQKILDNSYSIFLLDHILPREYQDDLEQIDFDAFCDKLEMIGYNLIPFIKNKNINGVVIGTSSCRDDELKSFPMPDYKMRKIFGDAEEDLMNILRRIMNKNGRRLY